MVRMGLFFACWSQRGLSLSNNVNFLSHRACVLAERSDGAEPIEENGAGSIYEFGLSVTTIAVAILRSAPHTAQPIASFQSRAGALPSTGGECSGLESELLDATLRNVIRCAHVISSLRSQEQTLGRYASKCYSLRSQEQTLGRYASKCYSLRSCHFFAPVSRTSSWTLRFEMLFAALMSFLRSGLKNKLLDATL